MDKSSFITPKEFQPFLCRIFDVAIVKKVTNAFARVCYGGQIPSVVEVEEEEKRRTVPKFKDIVLRVMRINSVKNALKIVKKSQSTSSEQEQEQKEKGKECETGGMS